MPFVKPNAIVRDTRAEEEQDRDRENVTMTNIFHIQKQLHKAGSSLEAVLAAAAKAHFGIRLSPHAPAEKPEVEAA